MHLWKHGLLTIYGSRKRSYICWVYRWLCLFCGVGFFFPSILILNDCIKSSWVSNNRILNFCCYATFAFISKLLVFPCTIVKLSQFEICIISSLLEKYFCRCYECWQIRKLEGGHITEWPQIQSYEAGKMVPGTCCKTDRIIISI